MSSGERRIPTAVPLFAALIFAAGVALWPGGGSAPISASGAVDATELPAEPEAFERSNAPSAPLTEAVKGIIRRAVDRAVAAGAQRDECDVSVLVKELGVKGSLVELQPDRPMKPASNLKLATTAVALAWEAEGRVELPQRGSPQERAPGWQAGRDGRGRPGMVAPRQRRHRLLVTGSASC